MIRLVLKLKHLIESLRVKRTLKGFKYCGQGVTLLPPYKFAGGNNIIIEDFVRIMPNSIFLIIGCNLIIKKYTAASYNLTIISSNHKPTVGVPTYFNNALHINEVVKGDIFVGEDCWLGVNVTLLSGAHLSRGCVVGANGVVNKEFPPYSVIVGCPARIIATKFTIEQILEHEKKMYPKEERLSEEYLRDVFDNYFVGLKSLGTSNITEDEIKRLREFYSEVNANLIF